MKQKYFLYIVTINRICAISYDDLIWTATFHSFLSNYLKLIISQLKINNLFIINDTVGIFKVNFSYTILYFMLRNY